MTESGQIELINLVKWFGRTLAVDNLSLTIPHASYCCLLGPSGCGKTTILRMIAGHEVPSEGEIMIGGEPVVGLSPKQRGTAMMFQSYALFPHRTCLENVAFNLKMRDVAKAERLERAREMLAQVRMEDFADRYPNQLSGGEQQRIALARAVITRPRVLLLDEPLSQLDEYLRSQMRSELREMQRQLGITFVHVTHTQLEAIAVADLLVVMDTGHIEQADTAHEIFTAPRNTYVARFMGGQNVMFGKLVSLNNGTAYLESSRGDHFTFPAEKAAVEKGENAYFSVPRDRIELRVATNGRGAEAEANTVIGTVGSVQFQGEWVRVTVDGAAEDEFIANLRSERFLENPVDRGDPVSARWSERDVHVLARDRHVDDEDERRRMFGE